MIGQVSPKGAVAGGDISRSAYRAHIENLSPAARRSRFRGVVTAAVKEQAVEAAMKAHVLPLSDGGALIGVAELHPIDETAAELAMSIDDEWRGQGYGGALFDAALSTAADMRYKRVLASCEASNAPMRRLIAKSTGLVSVEGGEIEAWLGPIDELAVHLG